MSWDTRTMFAFCAPMKNGKNIILKGQFFENFSSAPERKPKAIEWQPWLASYPADVRRWGMLALTLLRCKLRRAWRNARPDRSSSVTIYTQFNFSCGYGYRPVAAFSPTYAWKLPTLVYCTVEYKSVKEGDGNVVPLTLLKTTLLEPARDGTLINPCRLYGPYHAGI